MIFILLMTLSLVPVSSKTPVKKPDPGTIGKLGNSLHPQAKSSWALPWEENWDFRKKALESRTPVLMAKYKATLRDPLPGEMYNVALAAKMLAGTVVQPGETFSQNQTVGPYSSGRGYRAGPTYQGTKVVVGTGGGVCKIASLLYNVTTLSNLPVIERHFHSMTVPYVPPGQDATVSYGVKDFKFYNNTKGPILIWSQAVGNTLYMAFYGPEKPPQVFWHHKYLKQLDYWTVYRQNPALEPGTQKVVHQGQKGYIVDSWVTILYSDGKTETKTKGKSYYSPFPEVIEKGPDRL